MVTGREEVVTVDTLQKAAPDTPAGSIAASATRSEQGVGFGSGEMPVRCGDASPAGLERSLGNGPAERAWLWPGCAPAAAADRGEGGGHPARGASAVRQQLGKARGGVDGPGTCAARTAAPGRKPPSLWLGPATPRRPRQSPALCWANPRANPGREARCCKEARPVLQRSRDARKRLLQQLGPSFSVSTASRKPGLGIPQRELRADGPRASPRGFGCLPGEDPRLPDCCCGEQGSLGLDDPIKRRFYLQYRF